VRQVRNGVELPPIVADDHYDFNYQNEMLFNQPVVIMPVSGHEFTKYDFFRK
jgi:hypothetical protein